MKVLIDNGADVNDKDKVSSDSLPFYQWVCLVKVCTGWNDSTNEGCDHNYLDIVKILINNWENTYDGNAYQQYFE